MSTLKVQTDQLDYAPGSTVSITATGLGLGEALDLQVTHIGGSGPDGVWGTSDDTAGDNSGAGHDPWNVVDGGAGDLDGAVDGAIQTTWYVDPDDSLNAAFLLSATTSGPDRLRGTSDDQTATTAFFDAGPEITTTGISVSIDESAGLQNSTATPSPASDADDNDILASSLPSAFSTRLTALAAGTPIGAALSGYSGAAGNTGANVFTIAAGPGGVITDLLLTDSSGAALNGLDSGLDTLDGANILLYTDSSNNNIVLGRDGSASGAIVFAAYIEEIGTPVSAGKLWTVQYLPIKHPDSSNADDADDSVDLLNKVFVGTSQDLEFSLAGAPSGQNLFLMFTKANPTTVDVGGVVRITDPTIIATGKDPANQSTGAGITTGDTINTSQAGGPTTFGSNNQMLVEGEGIRFSFVTGARQDVTIPNQDQNEADVEANADFTGVFNVRAATFDVVQLQSGKTAVVKINAFTTTVQAGTQFIDGYADDTPVAVSSVRVFNELNQLIAHSNGSVSDPGITIQFASGVATIAGVKAHYRIEYTTATDHNRVLIENGGSGKGQASANMDIGGFKLLQVSTTTAEIGSKMIFEDDGPGISTTGTEPTLTVDETVLATNATQSFAANFTSAFGADGAGTLTYALAVTAGASGLTDTATNEAVHLALAAGVVEGRTAVTNALVFTVSVAANGDVTLDQLRAVVHPNTADHDDAVSLTDTLVRLTATKTDKDGDSAQATLNIGQNLVFEDDGPVITNKTDLLYANSSNPAPGGTGIFNYATGADARLTFSSSNSDFNTVTLTGTVGASAIANAAVTWASETSATAVFNISFDYKADPGSSAMTTATGAITFDKINDTYTVALAAPIEGFTVLTTGQALGFTGYTAGSSSIDQTQPDVSVAQLSSNFFVQFTGYSEPGGGTGANNLQALPPAGNLGDANGTGFVNGELFKQAATWVSVSNTANGTAGDTIQKGEVLDLDFFETNPQGFTALTPDTQASGIFLKFDGIGSEDLVVVLKLVDPDDSSRTTRALIIDNTDILKFGSTIPAGYNIVLDNNDGAVIIESNDFNTGTENYLIEGAQLLVSTEGVTGTAVNFNPVTGSGGGSTNSQSFGAATTDNDVIKISDIGFVTANSGTLNTKLTFHVAIADADGDATASQTLDVSIVAGKTFAGTADAEVFDFNQVGESPAGANRSIITGFQTGLDKIDLSGIDAITGGADDAFSYIGTDAFTAAGQLRFDAAISLLQGNVDGSGGAELEIQLTGIVTAPAVGDLIV